MSTSTSSFTRRSIFITGAAAGIGRAVAERFASEGWFVGLYDLDEAAVQALRQQFGADRAHAGRLDVAQSAQWAPMLEAFVKASGGRLDVLFNNAGIAVTAPFEEVPVERHHSVIDVNIKGVINGCHAALPWLKQTKHARVINMCSASAIFGQPMLSTYSATKSAVRSLTESLSIEWQRHGISVMDVLPLFVNTAMVRDEVSKMKTVKTLGVHLTADDVAKTVWRLAKPESASGLALHWPVGLQTRLFYAAGKCTPDWLNRWITAVLGGH